MSDIEETATPGRAPFFGTGDNGDRAVQEDAGPGRGIMPAWVQMCSGVAIDWKRAISQHVVLHFIKYGMAVQMGSGTTFNILMDEIVSLQKRKRQPLDLIILTTNLQVLEKGRDARNAHPEIFNDMQIILTGGSLHSSLHSLAGQYAAEGVRTELIFPRIVFLGAAGLNFDGGEVTITYQFHDELSTQISYATRPTDQRVILCDHTKLGNKAAWKADITAASLLANTRECIFLSTVPDDGEREMPVIKQQARAFDSLLERLMRDKAYEDKNLALRFVNKNGEVILPERSLSEKRKESRRRP
jgi:DeoR/GlpR family transcriptional regulator of sugar metabolism